MSEPDAFDLDAAWVRRAQGDLRGFMDALATRLEGALPGRVSISRHRDGLLSRETHVREIAVESDSARLTLTFHKGNLRASRAKVIRGVVIGNDQLSVEDWLKEVRAVIGGLAGSLSGASDSLKGFL